MKSQQCSNPDHSDREAAIYCSECGKYYCVECEAKLHNKVFADHAEFVTHDISGDASPFTGKCEAHSGSPLDFFCKDHFCLCCAKCMLEGGAHSNFRVNPLSEVDQRSIVARLPRIAAKLETLVRKARRLSEKGLQKKQQTFEQNICAVRDKIRTTFSELRAALDAREQDLLAQANRILAEHSVACGGGSSGDYVQGLKDAAVALDGVRRVEQFWNVTKPKEMIYRAGEARKAIKTLSRALENVVDSLCKSVTITVEFDEALTKIAGTFGDLRVGLASSLPKVAIEEVLTDKIAVSWDPVPSDAVYRVRMAAATAASTTSETENGVADLYKGKATICVVGGVKPGTEYSFWVQAKLYGCWGSWSSPTTVRTALPPGPPVVVGKTISSNQIYLQWDKVPNAYGYCLEMREGSLRSRANTAISDTADSGDSSGDGGESNDDEFVVIYNGPKASFIKDVLCPNAEYAFRVRAEYKDAVSSAWSSETTVAAADGWDCAWKECPESIKRKKKRYNLHPGNPRIATKTKSGHELLNKLDYCTVLGTKSLPSRKTTSWGIRVLRSKGNNGGYIFIGVAPFDIDQSANANFVRCGWFFYCFDSRLYSGPPHNYRRRMYGPRKKFGEYVGTGDTVGITIDTVKGELSFVLRSVNYGVAYQGIPLDKPLVPCALLYFQKDSVELLRH